MIRNLALALLAINLLYLSWSQWIDRNDPRWAVASAPPPRKPGAAPAAVVPPCATIGPFSEPELADQVRRKLEATGLDVHSRRASDTVHEGWWVHVDNTDLAGQSGAFETLREAGIRDAFAMPDDSRFRVSVGVFSSEQRARDRATQVQTLKLDALVSERLHEHVFTWIDLSGVAVEALSGRRLADADVPLEKLRVEVCPATTPAQPAAAGTDIIPAP